MGRRRYPPLAPSEVVAIVSALGFSFKRQVGSHAAYERLAADKKRRAVVTVDMAIATFDDSLIKSMIRQSEFSREAFYGATERTRKKL